MIGKLTALRVAGDFTLELSWDDGARSLLDLRALIFARAVLAPLREPEAFVQARLSADGWSIEWPCGIDFGAPQLRAWADAAAAEVAAQ